MSTDPPWLIVGLGNPGPRYAGNRHNVGAMVTEVLARRVNAAWKSHKGRADIVEGRFAGQRAVLARPRSFMNESGGPVASLIHFFKVPLDHVIVIHDELDLPFGTLRLKTGGGDNGHNGLRSVRASMGSGEFPRVRVGIGRPPGRQDPADFVLRDYAAAQRKELALQLEDAADAVEVLLSEGLVAAQNRFNS